MRLRALPAAALLALAAAPAPATMLDAPPPPQRLVLTAFGALRSNPIGLGVDGRLAFRQRLYASEAPALADNFAGLGVNLGFSPATVRAGLIAQLQPLTVLALYASADALWYFGTFDSLQSFPSARAGWGNDAIDAIAKLPPGDPRRAYAATGLQLTFGSRLQLKAGPIALANTLELIRAQASIREGDRVFLDPVQGALLPQKGFFLADDLDLVWVSDGGLVAGLRCSVLDPFFGARHYAPGEPEDADASQVRAGPLVAYRFFKRDGRAFNAPTVFLLANWYLHHKYRTGAEVTQAAPYLVAGFGFFGDLLGLGPVGP